MFVDMDLGCKGGRQPKGVDRRVTERKHFEYDCLVMVFGCRKRASGPSRHIKNHVISGLQWNVRMNGPHGFTLLPSDNATLLAVAEAPAGVARSERVGAGTVFCAVAWKVCSGQTHRCRPVVRGRQWVSTEMLSATWTTAAATTWRGQEAWYTTSFRHGDGLFIL